MSDSDWSAIDAREWSTVKSVAGRLATERDVQEGSAVFYVPVGEEYEPATPHDLSLPCCAWLHEDGQDRAPIIAIQAEVVNGTVTVGYRPLTGGNGICTLAELELLGEPGDEFFDAG